MGEQIGRPGADRAGGIVTTLRELVSAIDRRVPHAERSGEVGISRDAQLLRREAVAHIDALTRGRAHPNYDHALVAAIMTDDGGAPDVE